MSSKVSEKRRKAGWLVEIHYYGGSLLVGGGLAAWIDPGAGSAVLGLLLIAPAVKAWSWK